MLLPVQFNLLMDYVNFGKMQFIETIEEDFYSIERVTPDNWV